MSTRTPNLDLQKDLTTENYSVETVNTNLDKIDAAVAARLLASAYTANDVLAKIKTVDGTTSGLDADLLDGQHGSYYRNADQVDGIHFRINGGVVEYSTDGAGWNPVGTKLVAASDNTKHSWLALRHIDFSATTKMMAVASLRVDFAGTIRLRFQAKCGGSQPSQATIYIKSQNKPAGGVNGVSLGLIPAGTILAGVTGLGTPYSVFSSWGIVWTDYVWDIRVEPGDEIVMVLECIQVGGNMDVQNITAGYDSFSGATAI